MSGEQLTPPTAAASLDPLADALREAIADPETPPAGRVWCERLLAGDTAATAKEPDPKPTKKG